MKYRHSFHAANFADVHKHVTLLALLRALQRKDRGFLYVDTHAGAGRYDLDGPDSRHGSESRHGLVALRGATNLSSEELQDYLRCVAIAGSAADNANLYPGSPLLAAQLLRAQDRGVCFEILPPECRALERALGGFRRVHISRDDGFKGLTAWLPPPERRALVLVDPPYEDTAAELEAGLLAIRTILTRLPNAVIGVWYPIKDERTLVPWLARVAQHVSAPALSSELWIYPRDSRVSLNGSGMLIVNPPFQLDQRMDVWMPELAAAVDVLHQGGHARSWIVPEGGPGP